MYMVMLSVWNLLLAHRSGQQDIVVGTPVAGRMQEEWKETVGMFVNMIAMRNFPTFDRTYTDFYANLNNIHWMLLRIRSIRLMSLWHNWA